MQDVNAILADVADLAAEHNMRIEDVEDVVLKELLAEFASVTKNPDGFGWLIQRTCRDGDVEAALRLLPMYAASFESGLRTPPRCRPRSAKRDRNREDARERVK